jgi:hypothetical protein
MKTYKKWEESGVELDEYLDAPCEIDEEIYLHLAECTTPSFDTGEFMQIGEANDKTPIGTFTFSTVWTTADGRYIYLGILPAFKGSEYDYLDDLDKRKP